MYNQPYFIPGYFASRAPSMMSGFMNRSTSGALGNAFNGTRLATQSASNGLGLFSRLGSSLRAFKGINWGGLINNASKTLNVVNQAIPLVRQVGPMVNNMKSMVRIASIFKDETDKKPSLQRNKITNNTNNNSNYYFSKDSDTKAIYNSSFNDDNSPTFFVSSEE